MSSDDQMKSIMAGTSLKDTRSLKDRQRLQNIIQAQARTQQSKADLLEFGFVKIWTILLEFLMILYVRSQKTQTMPPHAQEHL